MKKLVLILLITAVFPLYSFTQIIALQRNNTYFSGGDGTLVLNSTGGKKKKKTAPKKDAKTDAAKGSKSTVTTNTKTEPKKSVKADPKKGKSKKETEKTKKQKQDVSYDLNFFAGPDLAFGFPMGRLRDSVNNGVGFNVRAEYFYAPNINLGLWTGFKSFSYDQVMVGKGHLTYIPIKLTATYYFDEGSFRPYANLGLGMYMVRQKYDAENYTFVRDPQTNKLDTIFEKKHLDGKQTKFGFSPSFGVLYNIQDEFFVDVNMSYEMILTDKKSSNFLGINLGLLYKFGF